MALKVRKFKEQQIAQADSHLLTVLGMIDTVEWETQQLKVLEGLKAGNSVLDSIHKVRINLLLACVLTVKSVGNERRGGAESHARD